VKLLESTAGAPPMKPYIFSMDSHVVEPRTLWQDGLPAR
jgi:hypothetical protein